MLHTISYEVSVFAIPRSTIEDFVEHIRDHFPCLECREHFKKMLSNYPLSNSTTGSMFREVYNYHGRVNGRILKKNLSFEDAESMFSTQSEDIYHYYPINRIGNGLWWILHSLAVKNPHLFMKILNIMRTRIPYNEISVPLSVHNFKNRNDYPRDVWELHAEINLLSGSENLPFETVSTFFKNDNGCSHGCTSNKKSQDRYVSNR